MKRRALLKTLGLSTTLGLAGCSTQNLASSDASTPTKTPDPANQKPIPSKAHVYSITGVDEAADRMGLVMSGFKMPRPATIELYRLRPTDGDPGTWTYYNRPRVPKPRPRLAFKSDGIKVSETKLDAVGKNRMYEVYNINFSPDNEPAGVPLHYRVDLVEHTLEGQRRTIGYTPMGVKNPKSGEMHFPNPNDAKAVSGEFDDYHYDRTVKDGDATITVVGSTNETRWHTPRKKGTKNRPIAVGRTLYTRHDYERPWAYQYTISEDTFTKWQQWNIEHYTANLDDGMADLAQLYRLVDDEYDGAEVLNNKTLARVARTLNETAENAGITTPLKKLRFVADFVQRIPYTDDSQIPENRPRVQHPITTLYKMTGDCEDKVALTISLLWQDAFPDYKLATYYISTPSHVGVAVKKDILGDAPLDSIGDRDKYLYADVTSPAPLGIYIEDSSTPHIRDTTPPGQPDVKEH